LSTVRITGVNAEVEDIDRIFIGAGAIIPVFFFPDWQYINLHEVLVYPGAFNEDYRNTAIHEFVHLIDKMDGTMDGVPEIILERRYVNRWTELVNETIQQM